MKHVLTIFAHFGVHSYCQRILISQSTRMSACLHATIGIPRRQGATGSAGLRQAIGIAIGTNPQVAEGEWEVATLYTHRKFSSRPASNI
jgi:hypothetical protein